MMLHRHFEKQENRERQQNVTTLSDVSPEAEASVFDTNPKEEYVPFAKDDTETEAPKRGRRKKADE